MHILKQIDQFLDKIEGHLIILILSLMILLSFGQMLLRKFFEIGIIWGDTLLRQWVLWPEFLGAFLAEKHEKHISIDVLTNLSSLYWKRIIKTFTHFSTYCGMHDGYIFCNHRGRSNDYPHCTKF